MSRRVGVIIFGLLVVTVFCAMLTFFVIVPPSVQISLAGVAGCEASQEQWRAHSDERFKRVEFWEERLAYIYRIHERFWPRLEVSDSAFEQGTSLHVLLTISDHSPKICDSVILPLFEHYIVSGVDINAYDHYGVTALHQAIIFRKVGFVEFLLENSADKSLPVKREEVSIHGMDALEIVEHFRPHSDDPKLKAITRILEGEI